MIKRPIKHFNSIGYHSKGNEIISSAQISGNTLHGATMNSLTGILGSLTQLSQAAIELFQSISTSSTETFNRISSISKRVEKINQKLPELEKYALENSGTLLYKTPCYELEKKSKMVLKHQDQQNIKSENLPPPLKWQYDNNCEPLPNFDNLDTNNKEGKCLNKYTNPGFFFESWAKSELAKQEQKKAERKRRRHRKRKEGKKKPGKLQSTTYDPLTGKKIVEKGARSTKQKVDPNYKPPPPPPTSGGNSIKNEKKVESDDDGPPQIENVRDLDNSSGPPPPPMLNESGGGGPPPPPPPPMPNSNNNSNNKSSTTNTSSNRNTNDSGSGGPPPPPPPSLADFEIPETNTGIIKIVKNTKAKPASRGGSGGLLDAIRNKGNKTGLKSVKERKLKQIEKSEEKSVSDILGAKFSLARGDSDDSDEEDDDFSDDDDDF